MAILFCNIGWMRHYAGDRPDDRIRRGGSYNDTAVGHEVCNFSAVRGKVYGYVQAPGQIKLEKLGAARNAGRVDNVLVVWTAGPDEGGTVVVGWYRNATVYRTPQRFATRTQLQVDNGLSTYRIVARAGDAVLLDELQRDALPVPRGVEGGIGQSNVWYAQKPGSAELVQRIFRVAMGGEPILELPDVDASAHEGDRRAHTHFRRERNAAIVAKKKKRVRADTGALACEACGFDFARFYGPQAADFCEVHHRLPLHRTEGVVETKLSDLAIVCSNCHRMIHRTDPMPSIEALRALIARQRGVRPSRARASAA